MKRSHTATCIKSACLLVGIKQIFAIFVENYFQEWKNSNSQENP